MKTFDQTFIPDTINVLSPGKVDTQRKIHTQNGLTFLSYIKIPAGLLWKSTESDVKFHAVKGTIDFFSYLFTIMHKITIPLISWLLPLWNTKSNEYTLIA